ncbi:SusC/RagA family TonB-linked outer membrane protein [Flavobacterium sp.]|uniref:SusC/RagA family TonB-linked outer membrane protein n=1 Tax=Flavobacterium sp. TaxID=239 RepID=UPI00391D83F4
MSMQSNAQTSVSVSGTVIDDTGLSIPGVNVIEKGTTNGVSTDLDGKFSLKVTGPKSVLVFSYLGYETFSQVVGTKKTFSIILKSEAAKLEDVVVIGYGTAKKSDLTGSVTSVSGDELKKIGLANVAETLTGRVAGVQVTSSEGSPDSQINIKIRGGGSISQDSSPLLIVDGFPVNSINDISPTDIENISILKDASSTAIYGARGAYGVIIITTKRGGKDGGKVSVSYNSFYGTKSIANTIPVLNPQDYANWQYEYAVLRDNLASYEVPFGGPWQPNQFDGVKGTNWQKEIYGRTGTVQSNDIGIRGGSDKLNYNFNYTKFNEKTIMLGSTFDRDNLSLNLRSKANEKIDLSFTMRYSNTEITGGGANEQNEVSSQDSRLKHSVGYAPIPLEGVTTDDTDEAISGYLIYPYTAVADNDRLQQRKNYNILGSISWKIVENLQLKSDFGLDNYFYNDNRFYGRSTYYVGNIPLVDNQGDPALVMRERREVRFRNANTLNYDFKKFLGNDHKLKLLVGQETLNFETTNKTSTIHGYPTFFGFNDAMNLSSLGDPFSVENFVSPEDKLISFFGRVNYDLKNRYIFTATMRADGSSKFLGNNKWGYFPSAAAAWKINEESFLKDVSWLNALKLRVSYGQAGNNNIPTGQTIQTFIPSTSAWINGVSNFWAPSRVMANPDLKWETMITQNIGLDYELFKGRVSGTVELYKNVTQDLLLAFRTPGTGYDFQYRNLGENQNTGLEASLNIAAIEKKNYGLSFAFNIGFNKNRINSLGELDDFGQPTNWSSTSIPDDYVVRVGNPIGLMYGYRNDGRYEVDDFDYNGGVYTLKPGVANASTVVGTVRPGSMKLKDLNGDGIVNADDQTVIGDANPLHTGGFVINANAYGFDLSAAFNWSFGNDIYNANKIEFSTAISNNNNGQYRNLSTTMAEGNRWTNIDASGQLVTDPTALAALNANTSMWSPYMVRNVFSDWAVEDASFLRLNTLTLGYSLPKDLLSKLAISRLRFYVTANNVFVLTNYSGPDPEVSTRRQTPLTPGVDYSAYPRSRQFLFGLNLNF